MGAFSLIKLIQINTDSIALYVFKEKFEYDKICIYQKENSDWFELQCFQADKDKVIYEVSDINKFILDDIGNIDFKISFFKNENIVKDLIIPISNSTNQPWQKGIVKVKKHEFFIKAKKINGNRLLIFKKLDDKEHCPNCWDNDLRASNNSNCPICGGTGFIERYSEPFFTWGGPYMNQPASPPKGTEDGYDLYNPNFGSTATITTLSDVPVDMYDLVYVINSGELNIVKRINQTFFANLMITQNLLIASLPSESKEYKAIVSKLEQKLKEINGVK